METLSIQWQVSVFLWSLYKGHGNFSAHVHKVSALVYPICSQGSVNPRFYSTVAYYVRKEIASAEINIMSLRIGLVDSPTVTRLIWSLYIQQSKNFPSPEPATSVLHWAQKLLIYSYNYAFRYMPLFILKLNNSWNLHFRCFLEICNIIISWCGLVKLYSEFWVQHVFLTAFYCLSRVRTVLTSLWALSLSYMASITKQLIKQHIHTLT